MIGHVESYDKNVQTGVVKYEGKFYEFYIDVWTSETPPRAGDDVDFLMDNDGNVTEVGLIGAYVKDMRPVKSRIVAGILGLLLGAVGAHRFYLGYYGIGLAQLAVTGITVGYGVIWGFLEGILLLTDNMNKDAKGRPLK